MENYDLEELCQRLLETMKPALIGLVKNTIQQASYDNVSVNEPLIQFEEETPVDSMGTGIVYKNNGEHVRYHITKDYEPPKAETFNGDAQQFTRWWNDFDTTINQRRRFTAAQKANILKKCLSSVERFKYDLDLPNNEEAYTYLLDKIHSIYNNRTGTALRLLARISSLKHVNNPEDHQGLETILSTAQTALAEHRTQPFSDSDKARIAEGIVDHLPATLKLEIARWTSEDQQSLSELVNHLTFVVDATRPKLEHSEKVSSPAKQSNSTTLKVVKTAQAQASQSSQPAPEKEFVCYFCKSSHRNNACTLNATQKKAAIEEQGRCLLCLRKHQGKCFTPKRCRACKSDVHYLMCECQTTPKTVDSKRVQVESTEDAAITRCFMTVLLHTKKGDARALFDTGSGINLITRHCAERLQLEQNSGANFIIQGVTGSRSYTQTYAKLIAEYNNKSFELLFYVVESIGATEQNRPPSSVLNLIRERSISLEDDPDKPVEILLNLNSSLSHLTEIIHLEAGYVLLNSDFGWMVAGGCTNEQFAPCKTVTISSMLDTEDADQDSQTQQLFLDKFLDQYVYEADNRWEVQLPLINVENLESNEQKCKAQLFRNLKRYRQNGLYEKVNQIFEEWKELDIIELAPNDRTEGPLHYLSHHVVVQESSQTTKLRLVINGSLEGSNGISLNDKLFKGVTTWSLLSSFWRLRRYQYPLIGDITKAFLMIGVSPIHRDLLRLFWVSDNNELLVYRFKRVPFGTSASPFLLFAALLKTFTTDVDEVKVQQILNSSFYVDDFLNSFKSRDEVETIRKTCTDVLARRGLKINWKEDEIVSVLGHRYNRLTDSISLNFPNDLISPNYVRDLLSIIPQIYDPNGFLSPILTAIRRILSQVWKRESKYDGVLLIEEKHEVNKLLNDAKAASTISIPRRIQFGDELIFHVFTDASIDTKGLCVYAGSSLSPSYQLIYSKGRLHHRRTIPEAEFDALMMAVELVPPLIEVFEPTAIFFWTDSTINVSRVNCTSVNKLTFHQALKVLRFKEVFKTRCIGHVSGTDNPADCITKLSSNFCLKDWLITVPPSQGTIVNSLIVDTSKDSLNHFDADFFLTKINEAHSFAELCKQFKIQDLIRAVQTSVWPKESQLLIQHKPINFKSQLRSLWFSVHENMIQVHLRHEPDNPKILLPYRHVFTELIIKHYHEESHCGIQTVRAKFCESYYSFKLRAMIRDLIDRCQFCKLTFGKRLTFKSGTIPEFRTEPPEHAFQVLSLDFTKIRIGKQTKIVLVATCLHSRAVFLKYLPNNTALSVLTALSQLFAIYGIPKIVYSDNEICLKRTAKLVNVLTEAAAKVTEHYPKIQWKFSVPLYPQSNGVTERMIGVTKRILKGIGLKEDTPPMLVEYFLAEATRLINSRPLFTAANRSVTPMDLIMGHTTTSLPDPLNSSITPMHQEIRLLQSIKRRLTAFWNDWASDYFYSLREVCAHAKTQTLNIGDSVLIREPHKVKKSILQIGTVINVYPGKDGTVRVCDVRDKDGQLWLRRSVSNLVRLNSLSMPPNSVTTVTK